MSPQLLLFLLRLFGAVLLLSFLGLIAWFLYQDLRATRLSATISAVGYGCLRVLSSPLANGPAVNTVFDLFPVTTIGRSSRNTIVLDDTYVSSEHAMLTWRESQWWFEDLGSRNGTQLNDAPVVGAAVVSAGDVFTIGSVKFKLELPGQNASEEQ
jgi:hypothetical protein